jgi:two-component system response regulator YesN
MYKVLIVDDDRATRYMLKRFKNWNPYGFMIEDEACDGKEAMRKLAEKEMDLVITDIKMPGMNGIEFLQELKRTKQDTCVIFLSTHSDFEYAKQGIRLGVFDYMTKPVDEVVLGEVLERTKSYLDDKNQQKIKYESERKVMLDSLHVYYPNNREKKMAALLISGDPKILPEAEELLSDISKVFGEDLMKVAMLLNLVLMKLSGSVCSLYPWIGKIEKIEFDDINDTVESFSDLGEKFREHISGMLGIVKKYELHQMDGIIKKTCEYVISHVEEEINLEKIAQDVHVRSDYIGKLFKKKTGSNFIDYVTKIKMEHAKFLLGTGELKNYEISDRLCYSSPDYFCRLFKNYTGCTPNEYRKGATE